MKWTEATLGDLCDVIIGRTPPRADSESWGSGFPWLSIADMNQGRLITTTKEQITAKGAERGRRILSGTVLLSFKLSIGKVARAGMPLFTNEAIAALPIKHPSRLDSAYLMRAIETLDLRSGANRAAMGATLNKKALAEISIPLPPMDDQARIASILDAMDRQRSGRGRVLGLLSRLSGAIWTDMFEGERLPRSRMGDLMRDQQIGLDRRASSQGPDRRYDYVKMDSITRDGGLDLSGLTRVDASSHEAGKYALYDGDLLFNTRNSRELVGKSAVYRGGPSLYNNNIMRIRFHDELLPDYAHLFLWSEDGRRQLEKRKSGTTSVFAIYGNSLDSLEIPVAPISSQRILAGRVESVKRQMAAERRVQMIDDELFRSLQYRVFGGGL